MTTPPAPIVNVTQTLDVNLLKFRLSAVPQYDGNPETLNNFVHSCTRIISAYPGLSPDATELILHQFQAKLSGRASLQLGSRNFTTWNDFRNELNSTFSLGKDLNNFRDDIVNARKNHNESTLDFAHRVRNLFDLLIDYLHSQNLSIQEKGTISKQCETLVINNIVHHCPHDLQRHFFTTKPSTIHDVITEIQRDNSFRALHQNTRPQSSSNTTPHYQHKGPTIPPKPQNNFFSFKPPNLPDFGHYQSWNKPALPPRRPNQFIPNYRQQNPQPSGRYHNENIFRPNQFQPRQPQRPTPMDISRTQVFNRPPYPKPSYNPYHNKPPYQTFQSQPVPEKMEVNAHELENQYTDHHYDPYDCNNYNHNPYYDENNYYSYQDQYEQISVLPKYDECPVQNSFEQLNLERPSTSGQSDLPEKIEETPNFHVPASEN